jgi:chaperone required for assembly of F1-ATPase
MLSRTFKRFYKQAAIAATADGVAVQLDGRPVKTPAGKPLVVPGAALAEAIAAEWADQGETVRPATMPLTQLAATALDRIGPERPAIVERLLSYAATDLLCYRADFPPDLAERQHAAWQPLLDWAAAELAAGLTVTVGVMAVEQPPAALAALAERLAAHDTWRLAAIQAACAAAGSLVLALALAEGRLNAEQTFGLSQLDETYQAEKWGEDYEAADRRAALKRDIDAAARLLALL